MRRPVPTLARCEKTITRESRYWRRNFRGLLSLDDLRQEGRIVALRVLDAFDPNRGTEVETVLTVALRKHYRRLIKRTLMRAFLYNVETRVPLDRRRADQPDEVLAARLLLARLAKLPSGTRRLAFELMRANGRLSLVAQRYQWSAYETRKRVHALRAMLTGDRHGVDRRDV